MSPHCWPNQKSVKKTWAKKDASSSEVLIWMVDGRPKMDKMAHYGSSWLMVLIMMLNDGKWLIIMVFPVVNDGHWQITQLIRTAIVACHLTPLLASPSRTGAKIRENSDTSFGFPWDWGDSTWPPGSSKLLQRGSQDWWPSRSSESAFPPHSLEYVGVRHGFPSRVEGPLMLDWWT